MSFNQLGYILFLGIVFTVFWTIPQRKRWGPWVLLWASIFFYGSWNGAFLFLLLGSTLVDFYCGRQIDRFSYSRPIQRSFLAISVIVNLGILGLFKYANFFGENINALLGALGWQPSVPMVDLILPVGISFYTFQSMSYSLDIYFGRLRPVHSFRNFMLFVAFFPQLVAGPIVRASEFLPQLKKRRILTEQDWGIGLYLILKGLFKKAVIADFLAATMVDQVFIDPALFTSAEVFLALVAFHFQVYCDFSGYTDIALGSARLFGFGLPENFIQPYLSRSPAEFWKRWHITLGRFAFDYVYRPLGGSRTSWWRTNLNVLIVFGVIGFWHGANWNYVLFGLYHGLGVLFSRWLGALQEFPVMQWLKQIPGGIRIVLTNVFVVGSLPLFRASNMETANKVYTQVFSDAGLSVDVYWAALAMLILALVTHILPMAWKEQAKVWFARQNAAMQAGAVMAVLFLVYKMTLINMTDFIYYQF